MKLSEVKQILPTLENVAFQLENGTFVPEHFHVTEIGMIIKHFIDCVRNNKEPLVTGEDGRAVLEIIYAAYASAGSGKKIELPFHPKVDRPIDLWR